MLHKTLVAGILVSMWATLASAQVQLDRFERQLEQIQRETRLKVDTAIPTDQRMLIDYGGFVSFNLLLLDDPGQSTHYLRQYDLNGYLRLNIDGVHEFFVRARTSYRDFNSGDDFDGNGDDLVEPTLDRAHYRFDLRRYMAAYKGEAVDYNVAVQVGRQLVHWGSGLTLSLELDGAIVTLENGPFSLDLLIAQTRDSITDLDSSRPSFTDETDRIFFGGKLTYTGSTRHRPYAYLLVQDDQNPNETLNSIVGATAISTQFKYDSFYVGLGSTGNLSDNLLYSVEFAYQGGESLSTSFSLAPTLVVTDFSGLQTEEEISAAAIDFQLDYLFNDVNRSRLSGELIIASGDTDRQHSTNAFGGNFPGTSDTSFNGFGLLNTGLAFSPNVSNLLLVRLGGSTFPLPTTKMFKRLQIGTNLFIINKLNRSAPIDEDTSSKTYVGFEADFFANWQITSDVSLAVRYGVFFPGAAIGGLFANTDHDPRHFLFTGLTFSF